jgi:metal-dependent amidase/aminoacylase/carboxypeptidase family protein
VGKEHILSAVAALSGRLIDMADQIHAHAELKFEAHRSAAVLTHFLEEYEFTVEKGVAGPETAFIARYGRGEPNLALLAEYDALAGLGHGCGHNLIGPASVGAAVALKERLRDEGLPGTVMVIGTPVRRVGPVKS